MSGLRWAAVAAAVSLLALTSTAAAGRLPRPLGAGYQKLSPGVHVLDLVSREQGQGGPKHLPRIAITVPSNWFNYDGWGMNDGGTLIVSFWDVNRVYPTGCRWRSKPMIDPGPGVDGLATALATRPLRHASKPTAVKLDGFRGKYLRWSVPSTFDISACRQGYFESWTAKGWASDRYQQGPGQVDRLWILDVNGQRLVVDAAYMPWATGKQRAELGQVVHSIRFLGTAGRQPAAVVGAARRPVVGNGPWIAYSNAPACAADGGCGGGEASSKGSDVFVIRAGGSPEPVAPAGGPNLWDVCPAFSPNGRLLAFAREGVGSRIVVVRIGPDGPIAAGRRDLKVPTGWARCPRWSADSSRLAYLSDGKVVVLGLDGRRRTRAKSDPPSADFTRTRGDGRKNALVSPTGKLIAWQRPDYAVVVSRPDGLDRRVLTPPQGRVSYGIAGWSPDGRKLLLMYADYGMCAVSVKPPFASETVVTDIPVDNPRLLPGYGDVSWQPLPRSIPRKLASVASGGRPTRVYASGIDDRGQIVGNLMRHGVHHGFVWRNGSMTLLGSQADAINARGQILGYLKYPNVNGPTQVALWENGRAKRVGLTGFWALNDRGQVIGYNRKRAAVWTNGKVRSLPFSVDRAVAINDLGQIVGETVGDGGQAGEWQDGKLTLLGHGYPVAIDSRGEILGSRDKDVVVWQHGRSIDIGHGYPVAINARGQVTGWRLLPSGDARAFLWSNGTMTDLGTLGGKESLPAAISNSGQVVGESTDAGGTQYGFVWQNGTMIRLPPPKGYAGDRTRAIAINDHDQIVGDDCIGDCEVRGYPNRFSVLWTLRGATVQTRQLLSRRR